MSEGYNPGERFQFSTSSFPVPGSTDRTWYLGQGGSLTDSVGDAGTATYHPDPAARPPSSIVEGGPGTIDWTPVPDGDGVGFVSQPLTTDVVALGPAAADIDITSSAADTDLGVVLSEVRPDGQEMLVSTGTQRASMREHRCGDIDTHPAGVHRPRPRAAPRRRDDGAGADPADRPHLPRRQPHTTERGCGRRGS